MSKFVLTAQLQLQAPRNSQQVLKQVQSQLRGVNIPVELKAGKQVQRQLQGITKDAQRATSAAESLGRSFGLAVKRFAAFTVASRAVSLFTNSLANAVDEAISFQREVVKIAQVTGKTVGELKSLEKTITSLSVNLGVSSRELLSVGRILSQAGIKARDLEVALSSLAKTTLAPTFENIEKTAEGAVAILAQFGEGVGALERQLGAINAVAGQFAVESGDLISAVRRFGGVFKSAGGSLEELLGLFTSVRATTRESSESIATGLRTIFTRIQRPRTIAFLKQFGVELLDVNGKFVGPLKAVEQLNKAFADLPQGDVRFIRIAEELGGFRQIGKVIPLIQQFETAERARQAAVDGGNSLTKDAATAQQALAVQITKVKEEFLALVRGIANDTTFQLFTRSALALASALIKIADALKPLIPLIGAFAAFKFAKGLGGFGAGVGSAIKGLGKNQGGIIQQFARGGFVPGSGNRDTVPAMLTPGEFVIKKSSAQKLGSGTLQAMNQNRFAAGGIVDRYKDVGVIGFVPGKTGIIDAAGKATPGTAGSRKSGSDVIGSLIANTNLEGNQAGLKELFGATGSKKINQLPPNLTDKFGSAKNWGQAAEALVKKLGFGGFTSGTAGIKTQGFGRTIPDPDQSETTLEEDIINTTTDQIRTAIGTVGRRIAKTVGVKNVKTKKAPQSIIDQIGIDSIAGKIFEGGITVIDGKPFDEKTSANLAPFDFPTGIGAAKGTIETLAKLEGIATDAKKTVSATIVKDVATKKINNAIAQEILNNKEFSTLRSQFANRKATQTRNKGGSIGGSGDTVPALLTPGEFVINKSAAQSIGYGNLNSMNKTGVARFNKGGPVQMLNSGGSVVGGSSAANLSIVLIGITSALATASAAVSKFGDKTDKASDQTAGTTIALEKVISSLTSVIGGAVVVFQSNKFGKAFAEGRQTIEDSASGLGNSLDKAASASTDTAGKVENQKAQAKKDEFGLTENKAKPTAAGTTDGQDFSTSKSRAADAKKSALFEQKRAKAIESQIPIKEQQLNNAKLEENIQKETIKNLEKNKKLTEESIASRDSDVEQAELESTTAQKDTLIAQEAQSASQRKVDKADEGLTKISDRGAKNQREIDVKKKEIEFREQQKAQRFGGDLSPEAAQDDAEIKRLRSEVQGLEEDNGKLRQGYVELADRKQKYNNELEEAKKVTNAAERAEENKNQELNKSRTAAENARRQVDRYGRDIKSAGRDAAKAADKTTKAETKLKNARKASAQAAKQAAQATKKAIKERQKAGNRRAIGGAVRAGGAFAGIAGAVIGVGQQIASGFAEFFRRQERIAIASENSSKAISAAGKAAQSENVGKVFSLEGIVRGLTDPAGLAKEFTENIARSQAEAGFAVAQGTAVTDRRKLKQGRFTTGEGADAQTDFAAAGKRTIEAQNRARAEFGALSGAERQAKEAEFAASGTQLITDFANSGASLAELERTADGLAGLNIEQRKQYQILIKTLVATREAQKAVNKANFDSLKITSAFGAAAAAVNNFTAGLETGSNSLAGYVSELEAAQQGVGIDASGAIDAIEQELVASAQGAGAGSLVSSLQGQANVARATNQFGVGAAGALEGLELSTDTETAKGQLEAALLSAIPEDADEATKKKLRQQIEAQVAGIENIQTADLSAVVKGVVDAGGKLSAGFQQAAKLQAQHNQVMIGLYKKQEELEAKAAEAKNKAIDTQLEAAKIFEDFGGSKLTGEAKLGARVAQFNNIGGLGGLGAQLTSGSAGDIRQAQGKINQTFFDQTDQFKVNAAARSVAGGGPGAFAGAQGIRDDKREEAKKANAALITFTKQRIALLKEELSIVQKKNAEEKSALDKLISGDVEGFLEGQAAAGAGAALRSGDASLAGLFGTSALGAGFKSLEGQGLSDQQLRSAEDLTLQRFGIQSTGVLSGTTSEEQALKGQGRELAGVLGDLAGDQAAFAQAEFTVQEAVINATNATFQNKLREVAEQNKTTTGGQSDVAGFFRGGPVYANRGMFVPRGTDTVPAMLTPGEFVVNRAAVQRGNNIQILRAMNSGGGASGQSKMRGGGVVRYYQDGGSVAPAISPEGITQLQGVFTQFAESVDKLVNSQFSVKLDTTNVNVNFNGASFLSTLKDDIKSELLETVKAEIGKAKPNNSGDIKTGNTVLGN